MRVLLVNYEYPNVTTNCGGGGRVTELLAAGLDRAGHTVRVVSDPADGHYATFPLRRHRAIARAIDAFEPDVLHGHFSLPSSLGLPRLAARHDVPLVVSAMGADVYDPTRFSLIRPLADRANRYIFRHADAVTVPSTDMATRVLGLHPGPRVVPYGIDPDNWLWRPRTLADGVQLLTVARLVERKHHTAAIDAVRLLREHGHDIHYDIVGTGPLADDLADYTADYPWCRLVGYTEDLQAEYDAADLFVLPSHHEAFGMVCLEALASGLPVVTSNTGGQTDIVTDAVGRTAPADSPARFGDAIADAIDHYAELQAATRHYVSQHFHVRDMIADYLGVYGDVLPDDVPRPTPALP